MFCTPCEHMFQRVQVQNLPDSGKDIAEHQGVHREVDNGKMRQLGITTIVDKMVPQAIAQVLTPMYEPQYYRTTSRLMVSAV